MTPPTRCNIFPWENEQDENDVTVNSTKRLTVKLIKPHPRGQTKYMANTVLIIRTLIVLVCKADGLRPPLRVACPSSLLWSTRCPWGADDRPSLINARVFTTGAGDRPTPRGRDISAPEMDHEGRQWKAGGTENLVGDSDDAFPPPLSHTFISTIALLSRLRERLFKAQYLVLYREVNQVLVTTLRSCAAVPSQVTRPGQLT